MLQWTKTWDRSLNWDLNWKIPKEAMKINLGSLESKTEKARKWSVQRKYKTTVWMTAPVDISMVETELLSALSISIAIINLLWQDTLE